MSSPRDQKASDAKPISNISKKTGSGSKTPKYFTFSTQHFIVSASNPPATQFGIDAYAMIKTESAYQAMLQEKESFENTINALNSKLTNIKNNSKRIRTEIKTITGDLEDSYLNTADTTEKVSNLERDNKKILQDIQDVESDISKILKKISSSTLLPKTPSEPWHIKLVNDAKTLVASASYHKNKANGSTTSIKTSQYSLASRQKALDEARKRGHKYWCQLNPAPRVIELKVQEGSHDTFLRVSATLK